MVRLKLEEIRKLHTHISSRLTVPHRYCYKQ